jgi:hypothetical protein
MPWRMKMKGIATACLLGVLLLTKPVASKPQEGSSAHFPFAYAQYGCAPTDALALDFYFTAQQSECGKISEPYVKIAIWKNLPKSAPYSIELHGGEGSGIRCLKSGACEAATSGTLHLDQFVNEKRSSGEYELHFKDGSVEKARFDVTWCHEKFVCG